MSHGLIWSTTQVDETARIQCSKISGVFWPDLYATRKCLDDGVWDEVDMSQCTIKDSDEMPLIVYSTYLQIPEHIINGSILTLNQVSSYKCLRWSNCTTVWLETRFCFILENVYIYIYIYHFNTLHQRVLLLYNLHIPCLGVV